MTKAGTARLRRRALQGRLVSRRFLRQGELEAGGARRNDGIVEAKDGRNWGLGKWGRDLGEDVEEVIPCRCSHIKGRIARAQP
jgi:hypothetical protein